MDTHCATDDEHPFLFPTRPLYDLVGALREGVPAGMGTGDAVQLEEWRHPRQGNRLVTNAMVHFEVGVLCVYAGVQCVVQGEESPSGQECGEAGFVRWHGELDVGSRLVEEVAEHGAGDNVCCRRPATPYGGFDGCHAAVGLEFLDQCIPHLAEVVETFLVGADEQYGYVIRFSGLVLPLTPFFGLIFVCADEADVHVQIAILVEAGKTQRYPVLSTACLDSPCLEKHVEDQL